MPGDARTFLQGTRFEEKVFEQIYFVSVVPLELVEGSLSVDRLGLETECERSQGS